MSPECFDRARRILNLAIVMYSELSFIDGARDLLFLHMISTCHSGDTPVSRMISTCQSQSNHIGTMVSV